MKDLGEVRQRLVEHAAVVARVQIPGRAPHLLCRTTMLLMANDQRQDETLSTQYNNMQQCLTLGDGQETIYSEQHLRRETTKSKFRRARSAPLWTG